MRTNIKMRVTPEQAKQVLRIVEEAGGHHRSGKKDGSFLWVLETEEGLIVDQVKALHNPDFYDNEPEEEIDADLFIRTNGTCEEPLLQSQIENWKVTKDNNPHPHAKLMAEYAKDAAETDRPWERWENRLAKDFDEWYDLLGHPHWHEELEYRRKPQVLKSFSDACKAIAESGTTFEQALSNLAAAFKPQRRTVLMGDGAVLPQPALEALADGARYYIVDNSYTEGIVKAEWRGGAIDHNRLIRGLIHQTEEDAKAWAEYLLKLTSVI